jgi:replication factor A2
MALTTTKGYDYNNQYQTTSYGAQGGSTGGGFLNQKGSQGGSQESPSGNKAFTILLPADAGSY